MDTCRRTGGGERKKAVQLEGRELDLRDSRCVIRWVKASSGDAERKPTRRRRAKGVQRNQSIQSIQRVQRTRGVDIMRCQHVFVPPFFVPGAGTRCGRSPSSEKLPGV
ncbi:hypothetical protein EYF80_048586 [Liparis tanakae]|uniref:Uncharacterized protein n=1 Tax=Liparis tanakae TaxID=230148 RepID=A0A4Z2FJW5_9TELE|nr:hypothetical protein EYF80_048586 [Liparis tanakae]